MTQKFIDMDSTLYHITVTFITQSITLFSFRQARDFKTVHLLVRQCKQGRWFQGLGERPNSDRKGAVDFGGRDRQRPWI